MRSFCFRCYTTNNAHKLNTFCRTRPQCLVMLANCPIFSSAMCISFPCPSELISFIHSFICDDFFHFIFQNKKLAWGWCRQTTETKRIDVIGRAISKTSNSNSVEKFSKFAPIRWCVPVTARHSMLVNNCCRAREPLATIAAPLVCAVESYSGFMLSVSLVISACDCCVYTSVVSLFKPAYTAPIPINVIYVFNTIPCLLSYRFNLNTMSRENQHAAFYYFLLYLYSQRMQHEKRR